MISPTDLFHPPPTPHFKTLVPDNIKFVRCMLHAIAKFLDVNIYEHLYTGSSSGVICPRIKLHVICPISLFGIRIKLEPAAIVKFMTLSACQHVAASGVIVKYLEASGHYVMEVQF
jgi:hypothetical protein